VVGLRLTIGTANRAATAEDAAFFEMRELGRRKDVLDGSAPPHPELHDQTALLANLAPDSGDVSTSPADCFAEWLGGRSLSGSIVNMVGKE
jgi:hypothetical protein